MVEPLVAYVPAGHGPLHSGELPVPTYPARQGRHLRSPEEKYDPTLQAPSQAGTVQCLAEGGRDDMPHMSMDTVTPSLQTQFTTRFWNPARPHPPVQGVQSVVVK